MIVFTTSIGITSKVLSESGCCYKKHQVALCRAGFLTRHRLDMPGKPGDVTRCPLTVAVCFHTVIAKAKAALLMETQQRKIKWDK